MNLTRQREDLKRAHEANVISKAQLDMALESPVFIWSYPLVEGTNSTREKLTEDEFQFINEHILEDYVFTNKDGEEVHHQWPIAVPYECFRISYANVPIYEQWFIGLNRLLCLHCDEQNIDGDRIKTWTITSDRRYSGAAKLWIWINEKQFDPNEMAKTEKIKITSRLAVKCSADDLNELSISPQVFLSYFLFDVMGGHNVVMRVKSNKQGKSVKWHQSREHYVVMNHDQAKHLQTHKSGITDEELVRAAHWRRAHLRRLVSEKFKHKKGSIVLVKRAWVGPTEWQGHDGKIYQVANINPNLTVTKQQQRKDSHEQQAGLLTGH